MSARIDLLEARTFFSATLSATISADLANLAKDAQTGKAHFATFLPLLKSHLNDIKSDLRNSGGKNAVLGAKLSADDGRASQLMKSTITALTAAELAVARRLAVDALHFAAHPTSETVKAHLAADVAGFSTAGTAVLARFGKATAAASIAAGKDVADILAANLTDDLLMTHVHAVMTDGGAFVSAVQADSQAMIADLAKLAGDVAAHA